MYSISTNYTSTNLLSRRKVMVSIHPPSVILFPSGVPVIKRGHSALRSDHNIPQITREQLGKIWKRRINERRKIELVPANESS